MSSLEPGAATPAVGEPRPVGGLRRLVPANAERDVDSKGIETSCDCVSSRKGGSPKRVTFVDDVLNEGAILESATKDDLNEAIICPSLNDSKKKSKKKAADYSISECCCKLESAASDPGSRRKGSASQEFEFLYKPGTEKSDAQKRHECSMSMKAKRAVAESCASMQAGKPPSATAKPCPGPCTPRHRTIPCEELIERRQPSWWEPALSRVLSVLVSTILLLAADGSVKPSPEHLAWTREFLECVRDREDKSPPNVAGLLAYIDQYAIDKRKSSIEEEESAAK